MKSFRQFVTQLNESFSNAYKAEEDKFHQLYPQRKVKTGLTTQVYNSMGDNIATYNHALKVLYINRTHDELTPT